MLFNDLYTQVLCEPAKEANTLYIVSGYASAALVRRHLSDIPHLKIVLIIGMTSRDGISKHEHELFKTFELDVFSNRFQCYYANRTLPIHAKAYAWFNNNTPIVGFIGSANYSQHAFLDRQYELLDFADPIEVKTYFDSILCHSIRCTHPQVESIIPIYEENENKKFKFTISKRPKQLSQFAPKMLHTPPPALDEHVTLTLLTQRQDRMPEKSGLNWGQRFGREPNQAYIAVPAHLYHSNFFPAIGVTFTIITDDGFSFKCVRAQANGKAIETPDDNSILGRYFRNRIGIPLGSFVSMEDLLIYGRTNITISKINNNLYHLDFSV